MDVVKVSGLDVAYEREGQGRPLVLLHGILADSREFAAQRSGLRSGFDVITPDLPGCGRSGDPPESWRMEEYSHALAGFLDAIGVSSAVVGGLSWGGILSQEFYRHYPRRVDGLVLIDTYAGWGGTLPPEEVRARRDEYLLQSERPGSEFIPGWMPGLLSPSTPPEVVRELEATMMEFHPSGYRTMIHSVAEANTLDLLPSITVPTILIWGELDVRSPVEGARAMQVLIPGSRLVVVPGVGHCVNLEAPDALNAAIRDFFRG